LVGTSSRYRVVRPIKRGGIAEVLEAVVYGGHDFERRVVLKQLLPTYVGDEKVVHAFIDEARIVGQLNHPNIVGILDFGMLDERPFQVLEHVDGLDLEEIMKLARNKSERFPPAVALHVTVEVARALEYAHAATDRDGRAMGIVHRDISPPNILVSWNGDVKLADFGVARAKRRIEETQVGLTKGTFAFMAPEQAKAAQVDGRSDLYSLGCVLHWMMSGLSPIEKDTVRLKVAAGGDLPVSGELPMDVAQIVRRATRHQKEERFLSAGDFADAAWSALLAHAKQDVRRATRAWLDTLRPKERQAKSSLNAVAQLFDVALLGSIDAPVRQFTAVGQVPLAFQEKGTEIVPDSLQAETVVSAGSSGSFSGLVRLPLDLVEPTRSDEEAPSISNSGEVDFFHTDNTVEVDRAEDTGSDKDDLIGTAVQGYRIMRVIGRGGWSTVYLARHESLGLEYAVKVLSPAATTEVGTKRLQREAKIMSQLRHPNVAQVIDFGVLGGGRPYLTMELLRGRTLYSLIMEAAPFPPERAAHYARQVALGLREAHRLGLVHRDLKPANVMVLSENGLEVLKILDFGIARTIDAALGETRLTAQDRLLGTPTYMAPEQILSPSNVTFASDLYSLGVVMYRMMMRSPPFEGTRSEVVEKQLRATPPQIPDDTGLGALVLGLLEKKPEDRPKSADEVIARLDEIGLDEPPAWTSFRPSLTSPIPDFTDTSPPPTNVLPIGRRSGLYASAFLLALMGTLSGLLGYTWWTQRQTRPPPPPQDELSIETPPKAELRPTIEPIEEPPPPALDPEPVQAPKKQIKKKPGTKDGLSALRSRFRESLRTNGLSKIDVAQDPSVSTLFAEWQAGLDSKNEARAETALLGLEEKLPELAGRASTLERRMERISKSLDGLKDKAPVEELQTLEGRYFEMRSAFKADAPPEEQRAFGKKLSSLERDLSRVRRSAAP
jgi:eukaryotic-like serine/threonine-protein kinase